MPHSTALLLGLHALPGFLLARCFDHTSGAKLPRQMNILAQFTIDNLFDQMTETTKFATAYRDALVLANDTAFFNGFDTVSSMATRNPVGRPDPRYKQASGYQGARSARLSLKFTF